MRTFFFFCICLCGVAITNAQIILSEDFDNWQDGIPVNWTLYNYQDAAVIELSPATDRNGEPDKACCINTIENNREGSTWHVTFRNIDDLFVIPKDAGYHYTFWARADVEGTEMWIGLEENYDQTHVEGSGWWQMPRIELTTEWKQYTYQEIALANEVKRFSIQLRSPGIIYIDDIRLFYPTTGLNTIKVDGQEIAFFSPSKTSYNYYLPYGSDPKNIPVVTYETSTADQIVELINATDLSGDESARTATLYVCNAEGETEEYNILFFILPRMDIYLCLGQSNMSGYGYLLPEDEGFIENTYLFSDKQLFEDASNPLNKYATPYNSPSRISPAYGFAKTLIGETENPIGLLVNAINGSAIQAWLKDSEDTRNLYANTLERAKEAQQWGVIKGVLWHQGCANSSDPEGYKPQLLQLVSDFRTDLGDENLFFVAGELPYWRGSGAGSTAFNEMIRTISTFIENSDWVSAEGLTPFLDENDPHFSRESAIVLGERYAEKVIKKYYTDPNSLIRIPETEVTYAISNRELSVFNIPAESSIMLYDVSGRNLFSTRVNSGTLTYVFPDTGVYFLVLKNKNESFNWKIITR